MNCIDPEVMTAYVDGHADASQAKLVDRHAAVCEKCRLKLEGFRAIKKKLGALALPPLPAELRRSLKALGQDEEPLRLGAGFWQPAFGLAAVTLAVFVARFDRAAPRADRVIAAERLTEEHVLAAAFPTSFEPGGLDWDAASEEEGDE